MTNQTSERSTLYNWIIIGLLLILIVGKGFYAFVVVGDKGPPGWDFRPVQDVPGQSPYAIYRLLPNPQHVRGAGGN